VADPPTQAQVCLKCGGRQRDPEARFCQFCGEIMPAAAAARRRIILLASGLVLATIIVLAAIKLIRGTVFGPRMARRTTRIAALSPGAYSPVARKAVLVPSPTASLLAATVTVRPAATPTTASPSTTTQPPTALPPPSYTPSLTAAISLRGYIDRPGGSLELRSGPHAAYSPVSEVRNGSMLDIVARTAAGDWLLVRTGDGIGGWAPTLFVHTEGSLLAVPILDAPPRPTTARPSLTATRTPLPPSPTPRAGPNPRFRTDKATIRGGDCATLRWDVEKVRAVYLDGSPQGGHGAVIVCPSVSQTFVLTIALLDGRRVDWPLDIEVLGTGSPPRFLIDHRGCLPHDLRLGQVKGRVFDRSGSIIVGALVEILVEGRPSIVPVGRTNQDGWYEFNLRSGQEATFVRLEIDGQVMSFYPEDYTVEARSRCYQQVDFRQR